jgi:hypothetical protein
MIGPRPLQVSAGSGRLRGKMVRGLGPMAVVAALLLLTLPATALAQPALPAPPGETTGEDPAEPEAQVPSVPPPLDIDFVDSVLDHAQPDFTIVALPTTLRLPRYGSAFRVTHRFGRPLGRGSFGSLVEDLFGLDSGALVGLEFRFGLARGSQIGIHRTSNRTIQLFLQQNLLRQALPEEAPAGATPGASFGLDARISVEGMNNFREEYSPAIAVIVSRSFGQGGAIYLQPMWVGNTTLPGIIADDDSTFLIGLGARLRVRPSVYLVGEYAPRLAGFQPGVSHATFGIEKRTGGHSFQLNFSNGFGTTMAQVARGGFNRDDWFIGFNISRKFF